MSKTTICDLKPEILAKILIFIPDKKNCFLVNRCFFRACCVAVNDKMCVNLSLEKGVNIIIKNILPDLINQLFLGY